MKAFAIKRTYTPEYYALLYDVFIAETLAGAAANAKMKLEAGNHFGDFELEEFGNNLYHCVNNEICGKLMPVKTCSYGLGLPGVVYTCLNCGKEIDDSQSEYFMVIERL